MIVRSLGGAFKALDETFLEPLLAALLPPRCGACDAPMATRREHHLCHLCHGALCANDGRRCKRCDVPIPGSPRLRCPRCAAQTPPFRAVHAPFLYGGPLGEVIRAAKFRGKEYLATAMGALIAPLLPRDKIWEAVVPVPLSPRRLRQRGYNQSALLASAVASRLNLRVRHALVRTRNTRPQSDLPLSQRAANVAGAFSAQPRVPPRILLIDDVVTSCETITHATRALIAGGAQVVDVAAVARAESVTMHAGLP